MTKTFKKAMAVIVVASMLISCFAFSGSAVGTPTGTEAMSVGLALSASEVAAGDTVTVTISLSNNYNAITMRWPVLYSKAFFELVGTDGGITAPIDSVTAVAGSTTTATSASFVPVAYSTDTYDAFTIQWIAGGNAQSGVGVFNSATAQNCFTFQLKVKDDATGSGEVFVPSDSTHFYYTGINDVNDATTAYNSTTPFNFSFAEHQAAAIPVAADPVLSAAEGYNVQLITFDGDETQYLAGFDVAEIFDNGGDFRDQFTVTNGTYSVSSDLFATGTVVTVYDAGGDIYAEYPIIFFGDVTGDGMIDLNDYSSCLFIANYELEATGASLYAADLLIEDAGSAFIDLNDVSLILFVSNFELGYDGYSQLHQSA